MDNLWFWPLVVVISIGLTVVLHPLLKRR